MSTPGNTAKLGTVHSNIQTAQRGPSLVGSEPAQRGFMGTIAYDYSRSIAEHSVNRRTFGQSPKIVGDRRRSTEAYRRVMSTWLSMMVCIAEGDLPQLFSPALLA